MKGYSFYNTIILACLLFVSISSLAEEKATSDTAPFDSENLILPSPLNDSLALVAIYNSTNGPFWSIPWNLNAPMNTWNGLTLNASGCVVELFLDGNNLTGTLPAAIGNLSQLRIMHMDNNNLMGTLPSEIGNLSELRIAFLDDNNFTGSIPSNWGNLNNLITLFLDNNMLTGAVPIEFASLDNLQNFDFFNNQIDSLPDLSGINTLQPNKLRVFNNNLSFDDILPNMGAALANNYAPQDSFLTKANVTVNAGTNYFIDLGIDEGITTNVYQWFKDGLPYFTGSTHKLHFPSIGFADSGTYWCTVTNPNAPDLTLHSRCVTINVVCGIVLGSYMPTLCHGESVEIGGIVYDASNPVGNEFLPGASVHGCDSLTNIQLSFYDPIEFDLEALLCTGDTIIVNGVSYHQGNPTGTELIENGSFRSCDSTVNVNLSFITPVSSGTLSQTLCPSEGIEINGTNYNQANPSGTEILSNAAFNGCDSIINIALNFHDPAINYFHQTFCTGEEITINGVVYNASNPTGVEVLPNQSYLSCDSIIDIDLSFDAAVQSELNQTLCVGESILVNGITYNEANPSGTETMPNASYLGCDSIAVVDLSFYSSPSNTINQTLCTGESIEINGITYNEANPTGNQTLENQALFGCDSTIQIELSFLEVPENNISTTLCDGESIEVNGVTYDQGNPNGTETLSNQAFNTCDSLVFVDLSFYPAAENFISSSLCYGESIEINGTTYDQDSPTGTEILTGQSFQSCDSIIYIDLSFYPEASSNLEQSLCYGESIIVNGVTYDEANPTGTEVLSNQSFQNCDSTVFVNLSFYPQAIHELNSSLCTGESLTVNGQVYDESNPSGTEVLTNASYLGCDSTVQIALNFYSPTNNNLDLVLCNEESITVNGAVYDKDNPTGTEILTNANFRNCDSTVIINLSFMPAVVHHVDDTLCPGTSIQVNGNTYDETTPTGTEIIAQGAVNGCDSTILVDLSFHPVVINNFNAELCEGASVTINGVVYNEANPSGTEIVVNGSQYGCDSTILVNLVFTQESIENLNNTLCDGESIIVNGTEYNKANPTGMETIPNGSFFGCDSVINVNLNFLDAIENTYNPTLCAEASLEINGNVYDQTNPTGTEVLENASYLSCDSTVFIDLSFHTTPSSNYTSTLCAGESLIINGTVYDQANPTGTEVLEDASYLACDSVVQVNLSFYPAASSNYNATLCAGESVEINGTIYNQANPTGVETLENANYQGCDSTIQINLSFHEAAVEEINSMLCSGTSIFINGTEYNEANPTGTEILPNASYLNCDSTIIIDLDFQELVSGDFNTTLCNGESIVINGTTYDQSNPTGMELMENGSFFGCDSMTNISLSFYTAAQSNITPTLCADESIEINGTIYNQANPSGTEILENANYQGCDSTLQINLSFFPESTTTIEETICQGSSYSINGVAYTTSGSFTEVVENGSSLGCDSTIFLNLTVISIENLEAANAGEDMISCETVAALQANLPVNSTGAWSSMSSAVLDHPALANTTVQNLATGENYFVWTLSTTLCPAYSSDTIKVMLEETAIAINDQVNMDFEDTDIDIDIINNDNLNGIEDWEISLVSEPPFGEVVTIGDELRYIKAEDFSGTIVFNYALCNANCPDLCDTAEVRIFVSSPPPPTVDSTLEIPSGITPNQDGVNDVFIVPHLEYFPDRYPQNELIIFNRWGNIVYQAKPYLNDWDGKNTAGKELPQGTYYYILRLSLSKGEIFKGDLSILKN